MNIFFIFPSIKLDLTVNHGVASLCGVMSSKGHNVDLYHPDTLNEKELRRELSSKDYNLCLVSSVTNQWPYALQMIKTVRKLSDIPIIVGGHHVTHYPEVLEENLEIDGICIGEGDIALNNLLENLENNEDYHHIDNLWFRHRKDGSLIKNELGNLVDDLDTLPFPDYSAFSKQSILNYPALMFSRGCPYNCTYCCNNSLRKLYKDKGKYIRVKSVGRAIQETKNLITEYNPRAINFDDDTFIKNREWLFAFLEAYKDLTDVPFNCNTRPETLNEELCKRLRAANCKIMSIGIESGNEQLRKKILKRNISNNSIKEAFKLLKQYQIKTSSFNMVGIPDETYEHYLDTVRLNREIDADYMQISIFYPYTDTELGKYAEEKGFISNNGTFSHGYFSRSMLNMPQFPGWKIKCAYTFFHFNVMKDKSLLKAVYYFLRYNLLKNAYLKKILRSFLSVFKPAY